MSRFVLCLSFLSIAAFALSLAGCGAPSDSPPSSEPASSGLEAAQDHGDHAGHAHTEEGPYASTLAELSEADRALAEKQQVCPVTGEPLGSMGKPYKVTVKGREVLLCCQGCETAIQGNPDEYLGKLPE